MKAVLLRLWFLKLFHKIKLEHLLFPKFNFFPISVNLILKIQFMSHLFLHRKAMSSS